MDGKVKSTNLQEISTFSWYRDVCKRFLDLMFSSIGLILLAIPMLIIAIIIKFDSPKEKILFRQQRVGKGGKLFTIFKFRSMRQDAPHEMATKDFENPEIYITPVGKFLRKASLDELPQLFNVFKGDMSLVGPRPLIPSEMEVLNLRHKYGADKVLPGITGLAQVHGRDEITNENKASYDGKYALDTSLILDVSIITKTIFDVLCSRGVHEGKIK